MTVFAVHETKDDVSAAAQFGPLRYLNRFYIHGDELEPDGNDWTIPTKYAKNIFHGIKQFDPAQDYLLINGDHLQLLAVAALLFSRFSSIMVLRFDRKLGEYIPVRLHSDLVETGAAVSNTANIGDTDGQDCSEDKGNAKLRKKFREIDRKGQDVNPFIKR